MADDQRTRKVRAVQRKAKAPVADVPTRRVKAVRRKAEPNLNAPPEGLLPQEALKAKTFRFVESNNNWGSGFTTDAYEVQLSDRTPVLRSPRRFEMFPGWRFELRDLEGSLRFTLELGRKKLVLDTLEVTAPDGEVIARIEQRPTLMEVKFDIFDGKGRERFLLFQAAAGYTSYDVLERGFRVARISKDKAPPVKNFFTLDGFVDAFRVDLDSALLDERDRVTLIAAALFMDRIYFTGENQ